MIELKNISKQYLKPGSEVAQQVLNGITHEINKGDAIAIVGPSGSGKSTLLNILGTLDKPSSGSVFLDGNQIDSLNDDELAGIRNQKIGFIFQMHHLLPQINVLENVVLPALAQSSKTQIKEFTNKAIKLLREVGLEEHIYKFPGQLSGGECQRVAVVRALINDPDILLADEPTGSLDQKSAEQIGDLLINLQQKKGIALVVVTHSQQLADKMKTKFSLENGQLIQLK